MSPTTPQQWPNTTFEHLWGGVLYSIFALDQNDIWTSEDGGRIRRSSDGGQTWKFQKTPDEVRAGLHRVFFRTSTTQQKVGWVVSEDGYLLHTNDGGQTWKVVQRFGDPQVPGEFAELWDVFFISDTLGWIAGKNILKRTTDGGSTWNDVQVATPQTDLEFYRFAFHGDASSFIGLVAGEPGIILVTTDGVLWNVSYDEELAPEPLVPENPEAFEIWDVAFVPGTTHAVAVGGKGNSQGYILESDFDAQGNPVTPWAQVIPPKPIFTIYALTALGNGNMAACGYAGDMLKRDASGWTLTHESACNTHLTTGPLLGATSAYHGGPVNPGQLTACFCGLWEEVRMSTDGGECWTSQSPGQTWRLRGLWFKVLQSGTTGWAVGQLLRIARTMDGGKTWIEKHLAYPPFTGSVPKKINSSLNAVAANAGDNRIVAVGVKGYIVRGQRVSPPSLPPEQEEWSFQYQDPPVVSVELKDVAWVRAAEEVFWAVGNAKTVLRTMDGGVTWTPISVHQDTHWTSVTDNGDGQLYLAGNDTSGKPVGYKVNNPAVASPGSLDMISLAWDAIAELNGVGVERIAAFQGEVFIVGTNSTGTGFAGIYDESASQVHHVYDSEIAPLRSVACIPGPNESAQSGMTLCFAGGDDGAFLYFDGVSWIEMKTGTSEDIVDLALPKPSSGWAVGNGLGDSIILSFRTQFLKKRPIDP